MKHVALAILCASLIGCEPERKGNISYTSVVTPAVENGMPLYEVENLLGPADDRCWYKRWDMGRRSEYSWGGRPAGWIVYPVWFYGSCPLAFEFSDQEWRLTIALCTPDSVLKHQISNPYTSTWPSKWQDTTNCKSRPYITR